MGHVINKRTLSERKRVNPADYNTDEWIVNPILPNAEKKYWKVEEEDILEMTQEEKDILDTSISSAKYIAAKQKVKDKINTRTHDLISAGFDYDTGTNVWHFPLSDEDQRNYMGLMLGSGYLTYEGEDRLRIKGSDSNGDVVYYEPADANAVATFYLYGVGFVKAQLEAGWAMKDSLSELSYTELVEWVDPRG